MRISTNQIYNVANNSMLEAQSSINKTQQQISTGRQVLTPADDPVAATKIMQLNQVLAQGEQFEKNIDLADNKLSLEEVALESITNVLQRVRELAVSAGNSAVLTPAEYKNISSELETRTEELLNLMNTRTANGEYVFAGHQGQTAPFVANGDGTFSYLGDEGQQSIQVSPEATIAVSDSGFEAFVNVASSHNRVVTSAFASNQSDPPVTITSGEVTNQILYDQFYPQDMVVTFDNSPATTFTVTEKTSGKILQAATPYVSGDDVVVQGVTFKMLGTPADGDGLSIESDNTQGILSVVGELAAVLEAADGSDQSKKDVARVVANSLDNLSNAVTQVSKTQAEIGARQNTLESSKDLLLNSNLYNQEVLSELQDVDMAEAATRLQMQSFILQAAQQSFVKVSGLSLFNFLR